MSSIDTTVDEEAGRFDAVVVGGGAAGLSGAVALGRARRSVLVVDAGQPRNAPADGVHMYLGREDTPPAELLAAGRAEARRYGVEIRQGEVVAAGRDDAGFRVTLADGAVVRARRLLVTTGLRDELPEVPGVAELWGSDVLHCPYCHGWEVRDRPVGVLGTGPLAVHQALMWRQWSDDVTLFLHTGPEPDDEEYEQLAVRGVAVVDGRVEALVRAGGEGRLTGVRLADGHVIDREVLVVAPVMAARADWLAPLGLTLTEQVVRGGVVGRYVATDPTGLTEVPGVWAAGNVADVTGQVVVSAAAGIRAGAAANADLIAEDTRRAVAARRAAVPQVPDLPDPKDLPDPETALPPAPERETDERVGSGSGSRHGL